MKMILAVISDHDNEAVSQALIKAGLRVTRIASTGGFLRRGSSTLMIGLDEDRIDEAVEIFRNHTTPLEDSSMKRATLFVLNVDHFSQV